VQHPGADGTKDYKGFERDSVSRIRDPLAGLRSRHAAKAVGARHTKAGGGKIA
jgi:hypothetical protein